MPMVYRRTFRFAAAHFNSLWAYQRVWDVGPQGCGFTVEQLMRLLGDIHGHNFRVELVLQGIFGRDESWLVDDVVLDKIVMEWANTNLSVHPDFVKRRLRATTEQMALVLYDKLVGRLHGLPHVEAVTVYETDDISATVEHGAR
jgi:6-pyruvoyl-tetrahydropterin synthase